MPGKQKILVVDDTPANIKILNDILKDKYQVSFAINGEDALELANSINKPDLILLDIMMPKVDGYEVCKKLKSNKKTAKIPVIFITALAKIEDESKGFEVGCVDYITKPISPPILHARVKTHLELKSSKAHVDRLLSKTLIGSIKMMSDIVSMVDPLVFSQSSRLKRCASLIGKALKIDGLWQLEIAATLSQIGTITLPVELLKKVKDDEELSLNERELYNSHPGIGMEIVANIPSLDVVANIIGKQNKPVPETDFETWDFETICSQIVKIVYDYDKLISSGKTSESALFILYENNKRYSQYLLNILDKVEKSKPQTIATTIRFNQLREGMVLLDDILCDGDVVLIKKYTEISESNLYLLKKNSKIRNIIEPIEVMAPTIF